MEIWDAYDTQENRLGIDLIRGEKIPEGMLHLVCEILVQHEDGSFLLMQRDPCKESWPGKWEASAGGSALKGEDPETCARRELEEETGICAEQMTQLYHSQTATAIHYGYLCKTDHPKDQIRLQEGETVAYQWMDPELFYAFMDTDDFIPTARERLKELRDRKER